MIFDIDKSTALVIFWALTVMLIGWTWFPALVAAMGGTRFQMRAFEKNENFPTGNGEPDYAHWAGQLRELGYEGVAIGGRRIDYLEAEWRVEAPLRIFWNRQKNVHAIVQRMPEPWNLWREVIFVTRLADGGMVTTRNLQVQSRDEVSTVLEQGLDSFDLIEVERLHLETLDSLKRRGQRPDSDDSLENLTASMQSAGTPGIRRVSQILGKKFLALHFIIHGCVSLPSGYFAGLDHWGLPLTNIVLCIIMRIGESAQRRQMAMVMRDALHKQVGGPFAPGQIRGPKG